MARNNALNISRLSKYNFKYITLEEVLVLEYLISYYQKKSLELVVPNRIETEMGLKRSKLQRAIDELSSKGFISVKVENLRTHYSLHIDEVVNSLSKIFTKENKYAYQYFYNVQNPNFFKKSKTKKTVVTQDRKEVKTKARVASEKVQMSLF